MQIDPSLAAGMREGLDYLEHYEYECTEQTVSRFLPNVLTYRALQSLGIDNPELMEKLPGLVEEGLERLRNQQNPDGLNVDHSCINEFAKCARQHSKSW